METQAILIGHLTIDEVCKLLRSECGIDVLDVRSMRSADYKIIEFYDSARTLQVINVFLNSYAAEDYASVYSGSSTLVTMEFSPEMSTLMAKLAQATGGYFQRIGGEAWVAAMLPA